MVKKKIIYSICITIIFIIMGFGITYANTVYLGDANLDGKIDISDSLKIQRYIASVKGQEREEWNLTQEQLKQADTDGNGIINITDLLNVQRYIAAKKSEVVREKHPEWITKLEKEVEEPEEEILPEGITLSETQVVLEKGSIKTLTAAITPTNATNKNVTWTSSNYNIVTVNEQGTITAVGVGEATITATTANGKKTTCHVRVQESPTAIKIDDDFEIDLADSVHTRQLQVTFIPETANTNKEITWSFEEIIETTADDLGEEDEEEQNEIISINNNGLLTANRVGKVKVKATTNMGLTSECTVTISQSPTGIRIVNEGSEEILQVGEEEYLDIELQPTIITKNDEVTWTSSNDNIVTVNEQGKITAKALGEATITATTANGKNATRKVIVKNGVTQINLDKSVMTLIYNSTEAQKKGKITANLTYSGDADTRITWSSDDEEIATVDQEGNVTAQGEGNTLIYAKNGDVESVCRVYVLEETTEGVKVKTNLDEIELFTNPNGTKDQYLYVTVYNTHGSIDSNNLSATIRNNNVASYTVIGIELDNETTGDVQDPNCAGYKTANYYVARYKISGNTEYTTTATITFNYGDVTKEIKAYKVDMPTEIHCNLTNSQVILSSQDSILEISKLNTRVISSIGEGQSANLEYYNDFTYISKDENIVKIEDNNIVSVNPGNTTIEIYEGRSGLSKEINVLVKEEDKQPEIKRITNASTNEELKDVKICAGSSANLNVIMAPIDSNNVEYTTNNINVSSSDENIVGVIKNGITDNNDGTFTLNMTVNAAQNKEGSTETKIYYQEDQTTSLEANKSIDVTVENPKVTIKSSNDTVIRGGDSVNFAIGFNDQISSSVTNLSIDTSKINLYYGNKINSLGKVVESGGIGGAILENVQKNSTDKQVNISFSTHNDSTKAGYFKIIAEAGAFTYQYEGRNIVSEEIRETGYVACIATTEANQYLSAVVGVKNAFNIKEYTYSLGEYQKDNDTQLTRTISTENRSNTNEWTSEKVIETGKKYRIATKIEYYTGDDEDCIETKTGYVTSLAHEATGNVSGGVEIYFFDASTATSGHNLSSDAIFIKSGGKTMLIDTGWANSKTKNSTADKLVNFIKKYNGNSKNIDYLLMTHFDVDHLSGYNDLVNKGCKFDKYIFSCNYLEHERYIKNDLKDDRLNKIMSDASGKTISVTSGNYIKLGDSYLNIFWPYPYEDIPANWLYTDDKEGHLLYKNGNTIRLKTDTWTDNYGMKGTTQSTQNNDSIVTKLILGNKKVLLTGDAVFFSEEFLTGKVAEEINSSYANLSNDDVIKEGKASGLKIDNSSSKSAYLNLVWDLLKANKNNWETNNQCRDRMEKQYHLSRFTAKDLSAQTLKLGHHGNPNATSIELLENVNPNKIVVNGLNYDHYIATVQNKDVYDPDIKYIKTNSKYRVCTYFENKGITVNKDNYKTYIKCAHYKTTNGYNRSALKLYLNSGNTTANWQYTRVNL